MCRGSVYSYTGEKSEEFKLAESLGVFDADMMSRELTDYENSIFKKYMSMRV